MKKTPLVFSLVPEQSIFMTVIISVLTFLSVLAFAIALSIGSGVTHWNGEWNKYATIQVINHANTESVQKILKDNNDKIESVTEISAAQMEQIMQPWISSGAKLTNYLPKMFEIRVKNASDMKKIRESIEPKAHFLTHSNALRTSMSAGWKLVAITMFVLILMLVSIGVCISCISKNIAMLHKHELEILNQVGATDRFIARQMQIIVGKIASVACLIGFVSALPIIILILSAAHSARVGLLATLTLTTGNIISLCILPILIVVFSVYITKQTTLKILSKRK